MHYRTIEFIPVDAPAWVEELHAALIAQAMEGFIFQGAVTREIVVQSPGDVSGRAVGIQSTALVFRKES